MSLTKLMNQNSTIKFGILLTVSAVMLSFLLPAQLSAEAANPDYQAVLLSGPLLLKDAYSLASAQNERLKMMREQQKYSQAQANEALSGALPQIHWRVSDLWQDTSGVSSSSQDITGFFDQKSQIENKLTFSQTIFHGLQEWSAYKGFLKQVQSDLWRVRRAEVDLYQDVALDYYTLLAAHPNC